MKKLRINNLKLKTVDMLQRNELKSIFGGYGGSGASSCTADCPNDKTVSCYGYACLATDNVGCSYTVGPNTPAKVRNC